MDGASSGGEPRVVEFTAKAAPMNAAKGSAPVQSKKTRSWSGHTVGDTQPVFYFDEAANQFYFLNVHKKYTVTLTPE